MIKKKVLRTIMIVLLTVILLNASSQLVYAESDGEPGESTTATEVSATVDETTSSTTSSTTASSTTVSSTTAFSTTASSTTASSTTASSTTTSSTTTSTITQTPSTKKVVMITGSAVNLRSGAGTSYSKIGVAKKGKTFTYLSSKKDKKGKVWYQIQYTSSKKAWVSGSYSKLKTITVQTTKGTTQTTKASAQTTAVSSLKRYIAITAEKATFYSGAGNSYSKVGSAKKGAKFLYLTTKKDKYGKIWYKIQYTASKAGWVNSTYAKHVNHDASFKPYMTRTLTIKKGSKSVRSEPSAKSKCLGKVSGGAKYTAIEWEEDGKTTWYAFKLKGRKVWISRYDVTVSDNFRKIPAKDFSDGSVPMIYLSPSKQPSNSYAYGKTNEQAQMYRVAASLKKILTENYVCSVYTAPSDLYISLDGRALDAYNYHADIYLAIHSNADGSRSKKSYGAVGYYQPGNPQSKTFAQNMVKEMARIAPRKSSTNSNVLNGMKAFDLTGYSDVRDPAYYGITSILAEVEYHDNEDSAKWIINNPDKIASALAKALESTFRLQRKK